MMGPSHRLLGALAGVTVAQATNQAWSMVAMSGIVAMTTAAGPASPDMDQTKPWVAVRKRLPGSVDQVMNHRYLTHWFGWPIIAYWRIGHLPPEASWPATALLVGWASHLLGDLLFGELHLFPWGGPSFGLGLDTDGFLETGKAKLWFKRPRRVLPFSPARVGLAVLTVWVLLAGLNLNLPGGVPA